MGLLEDARAFLSKYTSNVVLTGVLAYIIIKYLNGSERKEGFEESFSENIKIIQNDENGEIIFDTTNNYYSLIKNGKYIRSAKVLSTLQSNQESFTVVAKNLMNETPVKTFNTREEAEEFIKQPNNKLVNNSKYIIRKEKVNGENMNKKEFKEDLKAGDKVIVKVANNKPLGIIKKMISSDVAEVEYTTDSGITRIDRYYTTNLQKESVNWKERLNKIYKESFKEDTKDDEYNNWYIDNENKIIKEIEKLDKENKRTKTKMTFDQMRQIITNKFPKLKRDNFLSLWEDGDFSESFKKANYNPKDEEDLNEVSLRLYTKPFHKLSHSEQNDVYKTIEELNQESFKKKKW